MFKLINKENQTFHCTNFNFILFRQLLEDRFSLNNSAINICFYRMHQKKNGQLNLEHEMITNVVQIV